jgi:uncharacterized protein (TIGR00290 family)
MELHPEPVLLSWSGGKDSALALAALRADPSVRVAGLLTTLTDGERISMHGVPRVLLERQAAAAGLPLYLAALPQPCPNQAYQAAVSAALGRVAADHPRLRRVAFGDLYLEEIRRYREDRLAEDGLEAVFPLWGLDTAGLARDFVDRGYQARLVCVDTGRLSGELAGRAFDHRLLKELPAGCDPCGENGEFHTFVSGGPGFSPAVSYRAGDRSDDGRFARIELHA